MTTTTTSQTWPTTPLDAAQRAFDLLSAAPSPLRFEARHIEGLPAALDLPALKRWLLRDGTPGAVRDAVWRTLTSRARTDGPAWVVAAVGIAMPGLRRKAGLLARGWQGETADLDAELLVGFLERLRTIDLDQPNICQRLIDAGARAVRRSRRYVDRTESVRVERAWSLPPQRPWDHPDWVLTRAVAAAVIGPEECLLISATRLDDVPLAAVAEHLQVSAGTAATWRRKGEQRLLEAIRAGALEGLART